MDDAAYAAQPDDDAEADPMPTRHKLDADAFYRMAEAGILGEKDRVELIDGEIIDMAPIGQGHMAAVCGLTRALVMACKTKAIVSVQSSVRLGHLNVPQPDFAVFRPRADFYAAGAPPGPADILLLVEVADSSLRYDTRVKLPLYARAGIPELWIVDLKRRALDAYRRPEAGAYAEVSTHRPGDRLALSAMPGVVVRLDLFFA